MNGIQLSLRLNLVSEPPYEENYRGYLIVVQKEIVTKVKDRYAPPKRNNANQQFWEEVIEANTWTSTIYKKGSKLSGTLVTTGEFWIQETAIQVTKNFIDACDQSSN